MAEAEAVGGVRSGVGEGGGGGGGGQRMRMPFGGAAGPTTLALVLMLLATSATGTMAEEERLISRRSPDGGELAVSKHCRARFLFQFHRARRRHISKKLRVSFLRFEARRGREERGSPAP